MSAIVNFKTAEELALFIRFAKEHKLETDFPLDEVYADSYQHFHYNSDDLGELVNNAFKNKLLSRAELEYAVLDGYLYADNYVESEVLLKPSAAFKHFCGGEYCNKQGLITLTMIHDCVLHYATPRKLWDEQWLTLDTELQTVLGTTESKMTLTQLESHCLSVFPQ